MAIAIKQSNATLYSNGTVEARCGVHVYTLQTPNDEPELAITGAPPTRGDLETISSLQTKHFGALAGSLWTWILVKGGNVEGTIDNLTVVNRINDGLDATVGHKQHSSTDLDIWNETEMLLANMPIIIKL